MKNPPPTLKSIMKAPSSPPSEKRTVRWGENEKRTYDRDEGGLSQDTYIPRAGVNNPLEGRSGVQFTSENATGLEATQRAEQAASAARRAEQAASEARRATRKNMPTNPNSPPDTREEQVVNESSQLFKNIATQLTGAPTQIQNATGKVMDEVVGGVKSFLSNLLPTGPEQAEAQKPQSVSGPNGTGNGNRKPPERQVKGPRPESWVSATSGNNRGGKGGGAVGRG
jgi:hypothetical protein